METGRKDIKDARDGLRSVIRMQRRENQVSGFGGGQAAAMVSLSRISPIRITSGSCRRTARTAWAKLGVSMPEFNLLDERFLILVLKLDRIFNRDDVIMAAAVDCVDQSRHRGGFTASCGPGQQDEALPPLSQVRRETAVDSTIPEWVLRWEEGEWRPRVCLAESEDWREILRWRHEQSRNRDTCAPSVPHTGLRTREARGRFHISSAVISGPGTM